MSSNSSNLNYNTPTPAQPGSTSGRVQRYFPPERYVAAQAQRVTLTDYRGTVLLDSYVRPTQPVCDYRTAETGLQPHHLAEAPVFIDVQRQVASLIKDKILVGYALWEFLSVMNLSHAAINTRDTALFMSFRRTLNQKPNVMIPLQTLIKHFMGRDIGQNGDIPVERARAALDLFRSCEQTWEGIISTGAWPCALPPVEYRNFFT
ncbi:hypothetical protein C2E23DRAFT_885120 [Lenzites betulinus]|nr:hypothetical protein C2E23DRAFT_885120 [Lenzites betulinus]